jgi:hypothetical protein
MASMHTASGRNHPHPVLRRKRERFKRERLNRRSKTRVQVSAEVQLDSMEVMDSDPDLLTVVA